MKYKGFNGSVEYDAEGKTLWGRVLGVHEVIAYEGVSLAELEKDFRAGVDHYLESCARRGVEPAKPFSGSIMVRVTPALHQGATAAAQKRGMSLNRYLTAVIGHAIKKGGGQHKGR